MRLIDADALQRRICGAKCGCEYEDCWNDEGCVYDQFISNSHTINAVPVVFCRDCQHWKPTGSKAGNSFSDIEYIGGCEFTKYCRRESDFCSYGKRKEGADNDT